VAVSGGVQTSSGGLAINESEPRTAIGGTVPTEWHAFVDNFTPTAHSFIVIAICTNVAAVDNPSGLSKKASSRR
jgi:hypothetical protein